MKGLLILIIFLNEALAADKTRFLPIRGVTYISYTRGELPVSFGWQSEGYLGTTTDKGALAITNCAVTRTRPYSGEGSLECDADLVGGDPFRDKGSVFVDLRYAPPVGTVPVPPFETAREQCEKGPLDLRGKTVSVRVFCPRGSGGWPSQPTSLALFAKTVVVDADGVTHYPSLIGGVVNIVEDAWNLVTLTVREEASCDPIEPKPPCQYDGFNPASVSLLSLQLASGGKSQATYFGKIWFDDVRWGDGVNPKYGFEFVDDSITRMKQAKVDAVSLIVTWYTDATSSTVILPDEQKTHTDRELEATIVRLKREGVKVLLKPHVDLIDGGFRGDLNPLEPLGKGATEVQKKAVFDAWFESYCAFIRHYAQLAIENEVDAFSVGTELNMLTNADDGKSDRWRELIAEIRRLDKDYKNARHTGADLLLTYAANWDAFDLKSVPFWDDLDMIGVDAYFPLSNSPSPSEIEIQNGWSRYCWPGPPEKPKGGVHGVECPQWLEQLQSVSNATGKKVIFTEAGFRNIKLTTKEPGAYGLIGDVDGDGHVCRSDLSRLRKALNNCALNPDDCLGSLLSADINSDGSVDQNDENRLAEFLDENANPNPDDSFACVPNGGPALPYIKDADLQARAYRAAGTVLWSQPWFGGWFWWAWETRADAGGSCNIDFTPQNKPAEKYVAGPL